MIVIIGLFTSCISGQNSLMPNYKAVLEYNTEATLGEGAFWNYKTNELLWIDIEGKQLHIYNPISKVNKSIQMPSHIGTVVPIDDIFVLVALADGVYKLNTTTEELHLFTDMSADLQEGRLNDGKCDPSGRFWVGSMHWKQLEGEAKLFKIDSSGNYQTMIDSVTISNGIVWTSDSKIMYYIDTPTSTIQAFDFNNDTGTISNGRVVVQIPESLGYPDGMTIDEENMLWVGMWNGNAVLRFNPVTGKLMGKVEVPAHNITSCAFGGENLETLFITTARVDMTADELVKYPLSGSVFKVNPGVKGVESPFFIQNIEN
ncbi:SMP-30/gluconolactonase/LRE family protein [Formosa sp. PL04]|uniref:SMP-30/gluconolactonase/LRE family protein n=1 Tax=Formosa sp. PL04 TaxID=3081755 RepID=UPI0029822CC7|nr:SMP-30/gluconolactonase/LRE family protein [Formosa sp. PL04]MDW5287233.1 SMP-30/gluconolactonase/LRE family protein [Formosa sp. PL04]